MASWWGHQDNADCLVGACLLATGRRHVDREDLNNNNPRKCTPHRLAPSGVCYDFSGFSLVAMARLGRLSAPDMQDNVPGAETRSCRSAYYQTAIAICGAKNT